MRSFSYEILDSQGRTSAGLIKANDINHAANQLKGMGFLVLDLEEGRKGFKDIQFWQRQKKVPLGEVSLFCRQLASMLQAGIPLTQCLFALEEQTANSSFKKAIGNVATNVEAGVGFSDALEEESKIFSKLFIGMVKAGELGGTLDEALYQLSEQLQKDKALRDNIRSATFYPSMVGLFAIVLLLVMLIFIVPVFMKMFPPDVVLPVPTKMVLAASISIRTKWYYWLIITLSIVLGIRYFFTSSRGSLWLAKVMFRIPIFGPLLQKANIARFARTLGTLLSGGIPVLQALEVSGEATGNPLISKTLRDTREMVEEGQSIAEPLRKSNLFPPMVIQMVTIGEQSGSLVDMLLKISEFFEEEVAIITRGLTAMMEPLLLVFVGLTVGLMVISLYLPIFNAVTQVGI